MQDQCAPIAIFAYNRRDHLSACLTALAENPTAEQSELTIFCDGPKPGDTYGLVEAVRQVAHEWATRTPSAFARITVIEQPANRGLAESVISGVTDMLQHHDRVIVVEDDLVVSRDFLTFMNQGLDLYESDTEVISIHGFMYAVDVDLGQSVFLRGADCWGWATWRRGWEFFRADSAELLQELRQHPDRDDFDFRGAFPYTAMLEEQAAGKIDSWAVRWYASAFLANKMTLYPGRSLVVNTGQDSSGTNYISVDQARNSHQPELAVLTEPLQRILVRESRAAREAVTQTLNKSSQPSLIARLKSTALRIVGSHER